MDMIQEPHLRKVEKVNNTFESRGPLRPMYVSSGLCPRERFRNQTDFVRHDSIKTCFSLDL